MTGESSEIELACKASSNLWADPTTDSSGCNSKRENQTIWENAMINTVKCRSEIKQTQQG